MRWLILFRYTPGVYRVGFIGFRGYGDKLATIDILRLNMKTLKRLMKLGIHIYVIGALTLLAYMLGLFNLLFPSARFSEEIKMESGSEYQIPFRIKRSCIEKKCPIWFAIRFSSTRPEKENEFVRAEHIKEMFFHEGSGRYLFPADVYMKVMNEKGEIIFEENKEWGLSNTHSYGSRYFTAPFGGKYYCLSPGNYSAVIQIEKVDKELKGIETYFSMYSDSKIRCGS